MKTSSVSNLTSHFDFPFALPLTFGDIEVAVGILGIQLRGVYNVEGVDLGLVGYMYVLSSLPSKVSLFLPMQSR